MPTAQTRPIDVYFFATPNGQKVTIALEELGVAYNIVSVDITRGQQFEPEFLRISPNNRIPAIVDPEGPGGEPISIFESGAILQYLGRKFGALYPSEERARVEVEQWLYWQVGGLGPMAGQAHHFLLYAQEQIPYAMKRYVSEVKRLYGVMDKRLADREYLAGDYSIADIACIGWAKGWKGQAQNLEDFPHFAAWLERCLARPAVQRGLSTGKTHATNDQLDEEARKNLFQR